MGHKVSKLRAWFYQKRYLVKREIILREVERIAFGYNKDENIYDKYTKILGVLTKYDE